MVYTVIVVFLRHCLFIFGKGRGGGGKKDRLIEVACPSSMSERV